MLTQHRQNERIDPKNPRLSFLLRLPPVFPLPFLPSRLTRVDANQQSGLVRDWRTGSCASWAHPLSRGETAARWWVRPVQIWIRADLSFSVHGSLARVFLLVAGLPVHQLALTLRRGGSACLGFPFMVHHDLFLGSWVAENFQLIVTVLICGAVFRPSSHSSANC